MFYSYIGGRMGILTDTHPLTTFGAQPYFPRHLPRRAEDQSFPPPHLNVYTLFTKHAACYRKSCIPGSGGLWDKVCGGYVRGMFICIRQHRCSASFSHRKRCIRFGSPCSLADVVRWERRNIEEDTKMHVGERHGRNFVQKQ